VDNVSGEALEAKLIGLVLPNGLRVDEVELQAGTFRAVRDPFSLHLPAPARLVARLGARSIANFLEETTPETMRNFEVGTEGGHLYVRASVRILLEVRGLLVLRLDVEDGKRVMARLVDAQFMGVNPRQLIQSQLDQFNPLLDLADFPVEGEISRITISEGHVEVEALLSPPG